MTPPDDERLRTRFSELREADERGAPGYHSVRARRAAPGLDRPDRRMASRAALAIAAAAILLAIGVARKSLHTEIPPQPLSTWKSPTASLLRTPGIELVASSTLVSSMLDPVAAKSTLRTGASQ